jgi:hypothetical protein
MADVALHSGVVSPVDVLRKVSHRDDAEFADFSEGVKLGIAEQIGAISHIVAARRIAAVAVPGKMFASLVGWGTVGHLGGGLPCISGIRT